MLYESKRPTLALLLITLVSTACIVGKDKDGRDIVSFDPPPLQSAVTDVAPSSVQVQVGGTVTVLATTRVAGTIPRVGSTSPSIASGTVTGVSGTSAQITITGVAEGTTTIEVSGPNDPNGAAPKTVQVTVVPGSTQVQVSPATATLAPGQSTKLNCTVTRGGQLVQDAAVEWETSAPGIASVAKDGTVTGVADGDVLIRCKLATGENAAATVMVRSPVTARVSPASRTLTVGQTGTLSCIVSQSGQVLIGRFVRWSTSDASVVKVDASGNIQAVAEGTAIITCEDDASGVKATAQVTVTPLRTSSLCDPQQTPDAAALFDFSSLLLGRLDGFCSNATNNLNTGPVRPSSPSMPTQPRALDQSTFRIVGGVPSWTLGSSAAQILNSVYPCGRNQQGAVTLCGTPTTQPLPAGDYIIAYGVLHKPIPLSDPSNWYQYGFVFDADGNPANNFVPNPSFPGDFFGGGGDPSRSTDFWVTITGRPGINWDLTAKDARNNNVQAVQTNTRVTIQGATMFAMIPKSHFAVPNPRIRFTAFYHDGGFGFNGSRYNADVQRPVDQPLYTLPILMTDPTSPDRAGSRATRFE